MLPQLLVSKSAPNSFRMHFRLRNSGMQFIDLYFSDFFFSALQLRRSLVSPALIVSNLQRGAATTQSSGTADDVIVDFDDPEHLPLPEYPKRPDEPLHKRKQR